MRQSWETMTSISAGHIILTPTQPVGSGRPQRGSSPGPPDQESRALPTELPRPPQDVKLSDISWRGRYETNQPNKHTKLVTNQNILPKEHYRVDTKLVTNQNILPKEHYRVAAIRQIHHSAILQDLTLIIILSSTHFTPDCSEEKMHAKSLFLGFNGDLEKPGLEPGTFWSQGWGSTIRTRHHTYTHTHKCMIA